MRRALILLGIGIGVGLGIAAAGALPALPVFAAAERKDSEERTIVVDGRVRDYDLHLPPTYDGKRPMPLVIALHGGAADLRFAKKISSLSAKADKEGFIVAYPNGSGFFKDRWLTWNAGDCCGYALKRRIDDVQFIERLLDKLTAELNIDRKRVYLVGFSNGGMLAYEVACRMPERIAAIAPVAASMSGHEPKPAAPVSVIIFHGTGDDAVPYKGGTGKLARWGFPVNDKSVSYAVKFWCEADGLTGAPRSSTNGPVKAEEYGGDGGPAVTLYTVSGGKHAWPGGKRAWWGADQPTSQPPATDLIWAFFTAHPRP